jgi:rhodanese-related sulfurtransferase
MKILRAPILPFLVLGIVLQSPVLRAADYLSPGIRPDDLKLEIDRGAPPLMVDLRAPVEFRIAHIPGAINIPLNTLEQRLDELRAAQSQGLVVYCLNGTRTRKAEPILKRHEIWPFEHLQGALEAWLKLDYPVEKGGPPATGWH